MEVIIILLPSKKTSVLKIPLTYVYLLQFRIYLLFIKITNNLVQNLIRKGNPPLLFKCRHSLFNQTCLDSLILSFPLLSFIHIFHSVVFLYWSRQFSQFLPSRLLLLCLIISNMTYKFTFTLLFSIIYFISRNSTFYSFKKIVIENLLCTRYYSKHQ